MRRGGKRGERVRDAIDIMDFLMLLRRRCALGDRMCGQDVSRREVEDWKMGPERWQDGGWFWV